MHVKLSHPITLYNACILLIVLNASECWAPTKDDVARLDAFDQWCLRRILGITWQDHITNVEVRERTGLPWPSRLVQAVHKQPPTASDVTLVVRPMDGVTIAAAAAARPRQG